MSPLSKSKSKDKSTAKAVKEPKTTSTKPSSTSVNGGSNPTSGAFHVLETTPTSTNITQMPQSNGRLRNIVDETEEHLLDAAAEYDSVSNNGSCSGESEDHQKEKNNNNTTNNASSRTDPLPISDAEKREKIRLKNEKKHQRQRERRAQELHERCCSYLTSRKLESLAQKLVNMGFTSEAATMALIHNEGRVEDSALWIVEGGMDSKQNSLSNLDGSNVKIDISEELSKIIELESRFKCSKQEVEKVVVACEGDLQKTVEILMTQLKQQEAAAFHQKSEESTDQPTISSNGFHSNTTAKLTTNVKTQSVKSVPNSPPVQLHRRDDRDFNYTKPTLTTTAQMEAAAASKNVLYPSLKVQSTTAASNSNKFDWIKVNQNAGPSPLEKRWSASTSTGTPSLPIQATTPQPKSENRYVTDNDVKTMREPIHLMQRPQSSNGIRHNIPTAVVNNLGGSPPSSSNWYPNTANTADILKFGNGGGLSQQMQNLALASRSNINAQLMYSQDQYHHSQQFVPSSMESNGGGPGYYHNTATATTTRSSSLATPSSLGLFSNLVSSNSSRASTPIDWSSCGNNISYCDYTSIDWSLDLTSMALPNSTMKGKLGGSYSTPSKASFNRSAVDGGKLGA